MGTLNNLLIFAAGAAIGSVVTWKILSARYEARLQEEIESVKESFADLHNDEESEDEPVKPVEVDENKLAYDTLLNKHNYNTTIKKEDSNMTEPYEITYEDFGERDGFDVITMTYYADGVLTDEDDNPVEDVLGMVGCDLAARFAAKEEDANDRDRDSIYIRHEGMESDLEILRDYRSFSSVTGYGSPVYDE